MKQVTKAKSKGVILLVVFLAVALTGLIQVPTAKATTATYTFSATQDSYVQESSASTNYGAATTLQVVALGGAVCRTYINFNTSELTGKVIVSSTLKLYAASGVASPATYNVSLVNDTWAEGTITWNNQPTNYGDSQTTQIASTGWWSANVTDLTSANDTLQFKVADSNEASGVTAVFNSRTNAANNPILEVVVEVGPYFFDFHGVIDESTGVYLGGCNVTAYFDGFVPETFEVYGNRTKGFSAMPTYLVYDLSPNSREYWITGANANASDLYIYNDATTEYVINFLDYTGILKTYPYVEAQVNVEGVTVTVEKRKVDVQNSIIMALVEGRKYTLIIGDGSTTYTFGDLLMTATTGVQLTLKGAEFTKETLLTQKNVHIYATRNFTTGFISIYYEDTLNDTASVDIALTYTNGTTAYSTTETNQTFTVNYAADNATTYYLEATINHNTYGELPYRQVFLAEGESEISWDMSWLGNLSFNTAYIFPALLILFVAGCFSALNAEVGAVLVSIFAIILTIMGWIPIPVGSLVAALFFAILMALIYNKRRIQVIG